MKITIYMPKKEKNRDGGRRARGTRRARLPSAAFQLFWNLSKSQHTRGAGITAYKGVWLECTLPICDHRGPSAHSPHGRRCILLLNPRHVEASRDPGFDHIFEGFAQWGEIIEIERVLSSRIATTGANSGTDRQHRKYARTTQSRPCLTGCLSVPLHLKPHPTTATGRPPVESRVQRSVGAMFKRTPS